MTYIDHLFEMLQIHGERMNLLSSRFGFFCVFELESIIIRNAILFCFRWSVKNQMKSVDYLQNEKTTNQIYHQLESRMPTQKPRNNKGEPFVTRYTLLTMVTNQIYTL